MIQFYNLDVMMTSGNSMVLLCLGMIGYGIWKIVRIMIRSRRSECSSIEINRILAEAEVLKMQKEFKAAQAPCHQHPPQEEQEQNLLVF